MGSVVETAGKQTPKEQEDAAPKHEIIRFGRELGGAYLAYVEGEPKTPLEQQVT